MSPKVASNGALTSLWSLSSLSCHPVPPLTLSSPSLTSRKLFDTSWDEVTLVRLFVAGARPHVEASVPLLARHRIPGSLWLLSVNSLGRFEHCPRLGPLSAAVQPACSWAQKWRFTFGIGPTKSAVMVFGPRRHVPPCSVTLASAPLPVVFECPCQGVILTPSLCWTPHLNLASRGNRLFAQCVPWCKSERPSFAVGVHSLHFLRVAEHILGI